MGDDLREGRWYPARVIAALGKIGYQPVSTLLDLVDNSVSAGAAHVTIDVLTRREEREGRGRRRTFVSGFRITDDGSGMSQERLEDALALGSSDAYYPEGTLSKFGMGLKSASASLGRRLTIVSREIGDIQAHTAILDHDLIDRERRYVYVLRDSTDEEVARLDQVAGGRSGTLVEIDRIHEETMISPAEITEGLRRRAGVVYFFPLSEPPTPLELRIDGDSISATDPMCLDRVSAGADGDLDEFEWDGQEVRWIQRPQKIQLKADGSITATVTMTQLPHPPSVAYHTGQSRAQVRDLYMIGAGNYGFYIYRNGRLISWADSLGMVSQDQDHYGFRGRLEITSDADEVLNLDVTKSRIHLSEIAREQLTPLVLEGLKKSRSAWNGAKRRLESQSSVTTHSSINEDLTRIGKLEDEDERIDLRAAPLEEQRDLKRESRRRSRAAEPQTMRSGASRTSPSPSNTSICLITTSSGSEPTIRRVA